MGAPIDDVTLGQFYGDEAKRTLRVVYNEQILHPFQPYLIEATANQIEFFERVFHLDSGLPSRDQVWYWKELLGLIALSAALAGLVPLAQLLLRASGLPGRWCTLFPQPLPAPRGRGRLLFWGVFALGAAIACVTYIPLSELSQRLFVAASNREPTWFFPQRMNNAVMLWAFLNGLVGFLLFFGGYRLHGRQHGVRSEMWGARVGAAELARTCALAAVLFLAFYGLLFSIYAVLHVDYRFLFMGVRVFQPEMLLLLGMYVPFFLPFFLSNSFRVNGAMRFEGEAEWKSLLLAGVANSAGLLLIVIVQYRVDGHDRNGVLDRGLALREPALCGRADDVRAAVLQPVLLPADGEDLPGTGDHLPHLRDDPALEHRVLPAAVVRPGLEEGGSRRRASREHAVPPTLSDSGTLSGTAVT